MSSKLLSSERITTVFFYTMASISLNRVCTRVVQDKKFYQLLVNKNQNTTILRQTRNFNNATGTINLTKRNQFHEIGLNSIARNLTGSLQVNIQKKKKREKKIIMSSQKTKKKEKNHIESHSQ